MPTHRHIKQARHHLAPPAGFGMHHELLSGEQWLRTNGILSSTLDVPQGMAAVVELTDGSLRRYAAGFHEMRGQLPPGCYCVFYADLSPRLLTVSVEAQCQDGGRITLCITARVVIDDPRALLTGNASSAMRHLTLLIQSSARAVIESLPYPVVSQMPSDELAYHIRLRLPRRDLPPGLRVAGVYIDARQLDPARRRMQEEKTRYVEEADIIATKHEVNRYADEAIRSREAAARVYEREQAQHDVDLARIAQQLEAQRFQFEQQAEDRRWQQENRAKAAEIARDVLVEQSRADAQIAAQMAQRSPAHLGPQAEQYRADNAASFERLDKLLHDTMLPSNGSAGKPPNAPPGAQTASPDDLPPFLRDYYLLAEVPGLNPQIRRIGGHDAITIMTDRFCLNFVYDGRGKHGRPTVELHEGSYTSQVPWDDGQSIQHVVASIQRRYNGGNGHARQGTDGD
ncbi:MAG: hypothetical protein JW910_05760 [Anaerolineae bacterium]|nr:hypothetical protein [Anaerolineae bacterium]